MATQALPGSQIPLAATRFSPTSMAAGAAVLAVQTATGVVGFGP